MMDEGNTIDFILFFSFTSFDFCYSFVGIVSSFHLSLFFSLSLFVLGTRLSEKQKLPN